jgi:heme-degrading monooxygenase HmoA
MFARINEVTVKPDADQEALRKTSVDWRELIRQQAGYLGHVAVLQSEGRMTIITLWESPEAGQGWLDNPDFQKMREERIAPNYASWTTSDGTVETAELRQAVG